ncbi:MAG: hypothetical protein AB7S88_00130 [Candidatus Izemoplasmatales bacterium]
MKKLFIVWTFIVFIFGLMACDNQSITSISLTSSTTTSRPTTTTTTTWTMPSTWEDLEPGDLDIFMDSYDLYSENFILTSQLSVNSETEITVHYPSYSRVSNSSAQFDLDLGLDDFYLAYTQRNGLTLIEALDYYTVLDGKIMEYYANDSQLLHQRVAAEEVTVDSILSILYDLGFSNENTLQYLGNVVQISEYVFQGQVLFYRWDDFFGDGFISQFSILDRVDIDRTTLNVTFTFDPDYRGFLMEARINLIGIVAESSLLIEMDYIQDYRLGEVVRKTPGEYGFCVGVQANVEDIEFDAGINHGYNYSVVPNRDNWVRFYLDPGYYETAITSSNLVNTYIYNSDLEVVYSSGYPFHVTEAGHYYVNLYNDQSSTTLMNFYIKNLYLNDIYDETINGTNPGQWHLVSEGENDVNKITFPSNGMNFVLLLNIDYSIGNLDQFDVEYYSNYCNYSETQCSYRLEPTKDLTLNIKTKIPGELLLDYRLIPMIPTSQNLNDLEDISVYDLDNPISIGTTQNTAYFLVTIDHGGTYSIFTNYIFGRNTDLVYDIYTLSNEQIPLPNYNGNHLDAGTYIVKMYYSTGTGIGMFVPYVYEWE